MIPRFLLLLGSLVLTTTQSLAAGPSSIDVVCDVRASGAGHFRNVAVGQDEVIFRLWTAETGGSQLGNDYPVDMDKLLVTRLRTQTYDGVRGIAFYRIEAVIGTAANPVVVGSEDAWLDVTVGATTFTCAHSEDKNGQSVPPGPPARKKLAAAPFAIQASDISARVYNSTETSIASGMPNGGDTVLSFDSERWDTDTIHDNTVNSSRLMAKTSGKYLVYCHIHWTDESTAGSREVYVRLNGDAAGIIARDARSAAPTAGTIQSIATHWPLAVGDYVECVVRQSSGVVLRVGADPNLEEDAEFGLVKLP